MNNKLFSPPERVSLEYVQRLETRVKLLEEEKRVLLQKLSQACPSLTSSTSQACPSLTSSSSNSNVRDLGLPIAPPSSTVETVMKFSYYLLGVLLI